MSKVLWKPQSAQSFIKVVSYKHEMLDASHKL